MSKMDMYCASMNAEKIVRALEPYCHKIEIAGSLRRRCPTVNDIDLVCLPKDRELLINRARSRALVIRQGEQNVTLNWYGIRLDIFLAKPDESTLFEKIPSNWGSVLLCRTGPAEFNIGLATRAHELGFHWNPYRGITRDYEIIASRTEQEIFEALEMNYVEPWDRR